MSETRFQHRVALREACAIPGETPSGTPSSSMLETNKKLLRLIAARNTPLGASAATAVGDGDAMLTQ